MNGTACGDSDLSPAYLYTSLGANLLLFAVFVGSEVMGANKKTKYNGLLDACVRFLRQKEPNATSGQDTRTQP